MFERPSLEWQANQFPVLAKLIAANHGSFVTGTGSPPRAGEPHIRSCHRVADPMAEGYRSLARPAQPHRLPGLEASVAGKCCELKEIAQTSARPRSCIQTGAMILLRAPRPWRRRFAIELMPGRVETVPTSSAIESIARVPNAVACCRRMQTIAIAIYPRLGGPHRLPAVYDTFLVRAGVMSMAPTR